MSISLDIFTTLPLEDAQGLHLVLKDGSSYITAISKGQDTHREKPSFLLTFSKHTVAMRHLAPTTIPPKAPNSCQLPCAFTRRILEKAVLCRRIPLWLGWSSKVNCLPTDSWPVFSDLAQYQNSCNQMELWGSDEVLKQRVVPHGTKIMLTTCSSCIPCPGQMAVWHTSQKK